MPNWNNNFLTVSGAEEKVKDFAEKFYKNGIEAFVPTPEELLNTTAPAGINEPEKAKENLEKYGAEDWYEWRIKNWGVKWDVSELSSPNYHHDGSVTFTFDTPWGPPIEAFQKIAAMYPDLIFILEYMEPGMGFFGEAKFEDGEIAYDDTYEWGDRYVNGWWLYKNFIDLDDELDYLLENFDDDHFANEVVDVFNKNRDDEEFVSELFSLLEDGDKEEVEKFIKEYK